MKDELLQEQPTESLPPAERAETQTRKWKNPWRGKKKRWAILALVAVAAGALTAARLLGGSQAAATAASYQEAAAETRDITKSLSSSGTLEPADSYTVNTLVSGEILSDTFEKGDLVEEGQLLYTLDSSDASSSQTQAQNSYAQAQNSYQQAVKAKYPSADISGTVSEVYVNNGDSVNAGTELLKIVADNSIYIDFLFTYVDNSTFYVGQSATIFINGFAGTTTGTVQQVSSSTTASGNAAGSGRQLTTVRVKAVNPGLVTSDYTATAVIGSYSSYGNASIKISQSSVIIAAASGKVSGLNYLAGDMIKSGDRVCTITGDSVDNSIENAKISLNNAQTSLQNARNNLDDYSVTAPISGTVVTKTAKAGDKIEGGSSGTLCTIYDLSYLQMTMSIDELDISSVEVGQTVNITADAVADQTYTGVVTEVSVAGTTSGGVTTYPVTVRIDETDGLLPGMNVDAEIVLSSAEGVLAVPSGAVNRGGTVLVTADSPSAANALPDREAPEGYVYVAVETGVSDDSYTEITSGLQEGDIVAYIQTSGGGGMTMMMEPGMTMGGDVYVTTAAPGGAMPGGPGGGFGG
jgi:HlyD family secretion protein